MSSNHSGEKNAKYEGKCWLCRGPRVVARETQVRRQLRIFPQLQLQGPEPDARHLVLPVGPLHPHSPGGIILHTEKNMENLRGRSNRLIWYTNLISANFYECHFRKRREEIGHIKRRFRELGGPGVLSERGYCQKIHFIFSQHIAS